LGSIFGGSDTVRTGSDRVWTEFGQMVRTCSDRVRTEFGQMVRTSSDTVRTRFGHGSDRFGHGSDRVRTPPVLSGRLRTAGGEDLFLGEVFVGCSIAVAASCSIAVAAGCGIAVAPGENQRIPTFGKGFKTLSFPY
jgi:hypothetical protein